MECAPSMRAVKDHLTAPPKVSGGNEKDGRGGWPVGAPMLAQRAASEGGEGRPSRPPARGTRTIGMCSFDARNRGSTRLPLECSGELKECA
jgi:hypothetical protein